MKGKGAIVKAYVVTDWEGNAAVVFEKSNTAARRKGAQELDMLDEGVMSCYRDKNLEQYAPGPIPAITLVKHGWWFECLGCGDEIDDDTEYPVEEGDRVWCSQECRDKYTELEEKKKEIEATEIEKYTKVVLDRCPEAVITDSHVYISNSIPKCVRIEFSFPEMKYGAHFQWDRSLTPEGNFYVANGDMDAWNRSIEKKSRI